MIANPVDDINVSDANSKHVGALDLEEHSTELPAGALFDRSHVDAEWSSLSVSWYRHPVSLRHGVGGVDRV